MIKRSSRIQKQTGERFYPVTSAILNGDGENLFSLLTDRTFSGSVLNGRTELLINRALSTSDSWGFDNLDEPGPNGNGYILEATF